MNSVDTYNWLTLLIALIATYVALQQYHISRQKVKLDLYEKRFRIFCSIKNTLFEITKNADIDISELQSFKRETNESIFLFSSDINNFVKGILKKSGELRTAKRRIDSLIKSSKEPEPRQWSQINNEYTELLNWFTAEYQSIEQRFVEYLDFKRLL